MSTDFLEMQRRLERIEERIQQASARAGRRRNDIRLIAVSKQFPYEAIEAAWMLGLREFGENYVQEFALKADRVRSLAGVRVHLIGHLQSNKAHRAAELFDVIHTLDSLRLARRLEDAGLEREVMIEVKLSPEETKSGVPPEALGELVEALRNSPNLRLTGLMTMPPFSDDPEQSRPYFRRLRELAEHYGLARLSMGMSGDFEVAIEEGATDIRVGTAIFGNRQRN